MEAYLNEFVFRFNADAQRLLRRNPPMSDEATQATAPLTGRDGKPWPDPPCAHDAIAATTPGDAIVTALETVHANPRPSDRELLDAARSARAVAECAMAQADAAHDAGNDARACQLGEHALALLFVAALYRDVAGSTPRDDVRN